MTKRPPLHDCANCHRQTSDVLCGSCVKRAQQVIAELAGLADDLVITMTRQGRGAPGVGGRTHAEPPMPFIEGPKVDRAVRDVAILSEWAEHATGQSMRGSRLAWHSPVMHAQRATRLLASAVDWFRTDPQAGDCLEALHAIRASLRGAVDRPPTLTYAGPCGASVEVIVLDELEPGVLTPTVAPARCTASLWDDAHEVIIVCSVCKARHSAPEREVFQLAALENALLPLPEINVALTRLLGDAAPDLALIRQWRRRGNLRPAPHDIDTRTLYRAGDVLDLIRQGQASYEAAQEQASAEAEAVRAQVRERVRRYRARRAESA